MFFHLHTPHGARAHVSSSTHANGTHFTSTNNQFKKSPDTVVSGYRYLAGLTVSLCSAVLMLLLQSYAYMFGMHKRVCHDFVTFRDFRGGVVS